LKSFHLWIFNGHITFAQFLLIIIIITSPRLFSGDVLLFYFSLLLHHPNSRLECTSWNWDPPSCEV
jgi:hypothetical protein